MKNRTRSVVRTLALAVLAAVVATSCPTPIDDDLLLVVADRIAPLITISSPAEDSTYQFVLSVTGTLHDSSQTAGDGKGFVRTLAFDVTNDDDLDRTITFERDGTWTVDPPDPTFDFDPSTGAFLFMVDTSVLTGGHRLIFTATDLNANETEQEIRVQSAETGPVITFNNCPTLYSSEIPTSITLQGNIDPAHLDFTTTRYSVDPSIGMPRLNVPFTPAFDGEFSFTFYPRESPKLAGKLTVTVNARDMKGTPSSKTHDIYDDPSEPSGTFTIASGAAYATDSSTSLTFTITDAISSVKDRRFKNDSDPWNDGDWVDWTGGTLTLPWFLQAAEGTRTVHAQFRDAAMNVLDISDTIILDSVAPTVSHFRIDADAMYTTDSSRMVHLDFEVDDATSGSGMNEMKLWNDGEAEPVAWQAYADANNLDWQLADAEGLRTVFAKFTDHAGHVQTASDSIILDREGPVVSIVINNDDALTGSRIVSLTITASDPISGPKDMRLCNDGEPWMEWEEVVSPKPWTLKNETGLRRVYIEVRDEVDNKTSSFDEITYSP